MNKADLEFIRSEAEMGLPVGSMYNMDPNMLLALVDRIEEPEAACRYALDEWFDRVYPPDIFIGGPKSDPGVNEVREVANRLRAALAKNADASGGGKMKWFEDGDQIVVIRDDFVNLQESPAVFFPANSDIGIMVARPLFLDEPCQVYLIRTQKKKKQCDT